MPDVEPPPVGGSASASLSPALGALFYRFGVVYPHRTPAFSNPDVGPGSGPAAAGDDKARPPLPLWLIDPFLSARAGFGVPPAFRFEPGTPPEPARPPTQVGGGNSKPLVIRDVGPDVHPRVRKHTEQTGAIFNSLLRNGDIVQLGADEWRLRTTTWVETRAPTADDDEIDGVRVGDLWVDTSGPGLYFCVSNSPGVAAWHALA